LADVAALLGIRRLLGMRVRHLLGIRGAAVVRAARRWALLRIRSATVCPRRRTLCVVGLGLTEAATLRVGLWLVGLPTVAPHRLLLVCSVVVRRLLLWRLLLVVSRVRAGMCLWWWLLLLHRGLCAACASTRRSRWPLRCCAAPSLRCCNERNVRGPLVLELACVCRAHQRGGYTLKERPPPTHTHTRKDTRKHVNDEEEEEYSCV
jgi:hypothetical protein